MHGLVSAGKPSVRINFSLIFALVFDDCLVVFSVARILFFINWVPSAAVLLVAMGVVDLGTATPQKAFGQLGDAVRHANA